VGGEIQIELLAYDRSQFGRIQILSQSRKARAIFQDHQWEAAGMRDFGKTAADRIESFRPDEIWYREEGERIVPDLRLPQRIQINNWPDQISLTHDHSCGITGFSGFVSSPGLTGKVMRRYFAAATAASAQARSSAGAIPATRTRPKF